MKKLPEGWEARASFTRGRTFHKGAYRVEQLPGGKWALGRAEKWLCSTYRTAVDAMEAAEKEMSK